MISINYNGNFGNILFQYCFARLLAEKNNHTLVTPFPFPDILQPTDHKQFNEQSGIDTIYITDEAYANFRAQHGSDIMTLSSNSNFIVTGYFQDALLFNKYESLVKSYFKYQIPEKNTTDTLVLIRLGDFIHNGYNSEIIHYDWYNKTTAMMPGKKIALISKYKNVSIVSSDQQEEAYLKKITSNFNRVDANVDTSADFKMHLKYENIICSNSTFSWWGCFFNDCKNILTFSKFGQFTPINHRSHGIHINNLFNIRNVSQSIDGDFIDITQI